MAPTLKDIAQKVGRSVTTVSRALADYDDVSPETKALVQQVAVELGYIPNINAQRLRKQRADTLGLILPTFGPRFTDPYFSEFLAGVGNQAAKQGYDLLVSTRAPGDEELEAYRRKTWGRRVDGFLVVRTRCNDPRIAFLVENQVPFVAFGRTAQPGDFPYVDEDGVLGMQLVTEHLIERGHRHIVCLAPPAGLMFTTYRLQGFHQTMQAHGLAVDESLIVYGDLTQRSGYNLAQAILDREKPPTAIAACNDLMALGAMSAAQNQGLTVGRDIAITGFDDVPPAEHSHPPLTTVHQPIYKIGGMVCEMLIKLLRGEALAERQVILEPSLVVRASSGQAGQP
ncbi:MAG: LacI family DNA-binding transcriptional regulator [Anaerolineae bacterium]